MSCSRSIRRVAVSLLLTAATASAQKAPTTPSASTEQSCKAYVQKFYDWYTKAVFDEKQDPAFNRALSKKEFSFSPELTKLLRDDLTASAANPDEIVGLDWDPFIGGQDLPHHYKIKAVSLAGSNCKVTVEGKDPDSQPIVVVPVLRQIKASWQFINFFYPEEKGDLLHSLKLLAADRKKNR